MRERRGWKEGEGGRVGGERGARRRGGREEEREGDEEGEERGRKERRWGKKTKMLDARMIGPIAAIGFFQIFRIFQQRIIIGDIAFSNKRSWKNPEGEKLEEP